MHERLRGSKSLLTLCQIKIKPDFPFLADEIVAPHQDTNIKVAAFTVNEKSSNTIIKARMPLWKLLCVIGINAKMKSTYCATMEATMRHRDKCQNEINLLCHYGSYYAS